MDYIKLNAAAATISGIIGSIMEENGICAGEMRFVLDRIRAEVLMREASDAEAILFNMKKERDEMNKKEEKNDSEKPPQGA